MRKMNASSIKLVAITVAATLVLCLAIGGSVAWLTAESEPVTNTFTVGNINVALADYQMMALSLDGDWSDPMKMVPGNDVSLSTTSLVLDESEASWLFIKVDTSDNYDDYLEEFKLADVATEETVATETELMAMNTVQWIAGTGLDTENGQNGVPVGVYYIEARATTADDVEVYELKGTSTVKLSVTKDMLDAIAKKPETAPTLTFTAYAVQRDNVEDAATAWSIATASSEKAATDATTPAAETANA